MVSQIKQAGNPCYQSGPREDISSTAKAKLTEAQQTPREATPQTPARQKLEAARQAQPDASQSEEPSRVRQQLAQQRRPEPSIVKDITQGLSR